MTKVQKMHQRNPSNVIPTFQGDRFDGEIDNWPIFLKEFYEQIVQNSNYSNKNKLHCLKNSICNEAKLHIFYEKNLKNAINLLIQKYCSINTINEIVQNFSLCALVQ